LSQTDLVYGYTFIHTLLAQSI